MKIHRAFIGEFEKVLFFIYSICSLMAWILLIWTFLTRNLSIDALKMFPLFFVSQLIFMPLFFIMFTTPTNKEGKIKPTLGNIIGYVLMLYICYFVSNFVVTKYIEGLV